MSGSDKRGQWRPLFGAAVAAVLAYWSATQPRGALPPASAPDRDPDAQGAAITYDPGSAIPEATDNPALAPTLIPAPPIGVAERCRRVFAAGAQYFMLNILINRAENPVTLDPSVTGVALMDALARMQGTPESPHIMLEEMNKRGANAWSPRDWYDRSSAGKINGWENVEPGHAVFIGQPNGLPDLLGIVLNYEDGTLRMVVEERTPEGEKIFTEFHYEPASGRAEITPVHSSKTLPPKPAPKPFEKLHVFDALVALSLVCGDQVPAASNPDASIIGQPGAEKQRTPPPLSTVDFAIAAAVESINNPPKADKRFTRVFN